jgi:hypothetical protein
LAAAAIMVAMAFSSPMAAGDGGKKWTVMVYMDADNSLETYGWLNLEWLESVGSTDDVNIVVLMDTMTTETELLYVKNGESVQVDTTGTGYDLPDEENMGDGKLLEWFIETSCDMYPAERYFVDLWDHGGAFNGICWDDTTFEEEGVEDCILLPEMREAFWGAYNTTSEIIDVVGFDACLMAMPEVAYQLRGLADYLVFSEELVYGQGFPYNTIAADLVANPGMGGEQLSTTIAKDFAAYYTSMMGYNDWTISVFEMSYMDQLTAAVDVLAKEMLRTLPVYVNKFTNDRAQAEEYYYFYDIDLMSYAENLVMDTGITDVALKKAAADVVTAVGDGVVLSLASYPHRGSHGLAIYFPSTPTDGAFSMKDIYITIPFAQDTAWYDFIDAFANFQGRSWVAEKLSY